MGSWLKAELKGKRGAGGEIEVEKLFESALDNYLPPSLEFSKGGNRECLMDAEDERPPAGRKKQECCTIMMIESEIEDFVFIFAASSCSFVGVEFLMSLKIGFFLLLLGSVGFVLIAFGSLVVCSEQGCQIFTLLPVLIGFGTKE